MIDSKWRYIILGFSLIITVLSIIAYFIFNFPFLFIFLFLPPIFLFGKNDKKPTISSISNQCSNCGNKIKDKTYEFCPFCGKKLKNEM